WQLSPPMAEGVSVRWSSGCNVAAILFLAIVGFSWRLLARATTVPLLKDNLREDSDEDQHSSPINRWSALSQNRFAAVLVGMVAMMGLLIEVTNTLKLPGFSSAGFSLDLIGSAFLQTPMSFLWLAAAIAGFTLTLRTRSTD